MTRHQLIKSGVINAILMEIELTSRGVAILLNNNFAYEVISCKKIKMVILFA